MSGYLRYNGTGVPIIDNLMAVIERAGDWYHHTEEWSEESWIEGKSCHEVIQEAVDKAADEIIQAMKLASEKR